MRDKITLQKDGRYKLILQQDMRDVLVMAMASCLHFDGTTYPDYLYALLQETLQQLQQEERPKLRRSQLLAFFTYGSQYLDDSTAILLRGMIK